MSLYFKERIDEQQQQHEDGMITFTYPWIIPIERLDEFANEQNWNYREIDFYRKFGTTYLFENETWHMTLTKDKIRVSTVNRNIYLDVQPVFYRGWNGFCNISYNLYYDNDMRFLYYSSQRIQMIQLQNEDTFETPDEYMTKFKEALNKNKVAKIIVFIEMHLPAKYFYRPFEAPSSRLSTIFCSDYPSNIEDDFRFEFLNKGDVMIKCIDGSVLALRAVLNISCSIMKNYLLDSESVLVVDHFIDVVKPIITFLHTHCFEMPKTYDLNYVKRLFEAIDFFKPERRSEIKDAIHQSLCRKFVTETHNFNSILQMLALACQHSLLDLQRMLITVIGCKYYLQWQDTFPEDARNDANPLFLEIFGSTRDGFWNFRDINGYIDKVYKESFLTNVILQ